MCTVYRESFVKEYFCDMSIVTVFVRKCLQIIQVAKSPELFKKTRKCLQIHQDSQNLQTFLLRMIPDIRVH